jgi:hypothetical protein
MPLPARGEDTAAEVRPSAEPDLQTALSLARAATVALLSLSPLSHREIVAALNSELEKLKAAGGAENAAAVEALSGYLRDAA